MIDKDTFACAEWRRSSFSGSGDTGGGNCVEVAPNLPGMIAVRDSKNPTGPALVFAPAAFAAFLDTVKAGQLDG
jgi:hypothetical protein